MSRDPLEQLLAMLAPELSAVNALIRERMTSEHAPRIPQVTAHLIEAGGKRIRPLLTVAAATLYGYAGENHRKLAATVEFIHTATLLHDDVVDESTQRRGRPTANLLWDNKSSVLVGDYLFARAFQLMVETGSLKVLDILADAAATIAEGEVLQLTVARSLTVTEPVYMQVIRGKTAALFAAACEAGGVVAGASADDCAALRTYGDALGLSFQIADDVLDYGGREAAMGKNPGDDFREGKVTLPLLYALQSADAVDMAFWDRVVARGDLRDGDLDHALALLDRHGAMDRARARARAVADDAKAALSGLPCGAVRDLLAELADYVVARVA